MAHCLDEAGIDYLVLEKNNEIAPNVGSFVGIMPNGAHILDQLGLFHLVEAEIEPMEHANINFPDGFSFRSAFPAALHERSVVSDSPLAITVI